MIVDTVTVIFRSGAGGQGCSHFGKLGTGRIVGTGGDGGDGGDVLVRASPHLYDLSKFSNNKTFIARDGERGREWNKTGKNASDLLVDVPCGTRLVCEGILLADLVQAGSTHRLCQGGSGGKGNNRRNFTVAAQNPQEKQVTLDFRIPNDVAIVGFANSGKTSLFNALTGKSHKVADYPFTTTACSCAEADWKRERFIVLDTPAVKKLKPSNAHSKNENLFLRHLLRSRIILCLSDDSLEYQGQWRQLREEIARFDASLLEGKQIVQVITKQGPGESGPLPPELCRIDSYERTTIEQFKPFLLKHLNATGPEIASGPTPPESADGPGQVRGQGNNGRR